MGASPGGPIATVAKRSVSVEEAEDVLANMKEVIRGIADGTARKYFSPFRPSPLLRQAGKRQTKKAGPPRTSPFDPLVQLGSSQFGSNLVANCAVYAVFTGLSGH